MFTIGSANIKQFLDVFQHFVAVSALYRCIQLFRKRSTFETSEEQYTGYKCPKYLRFVAVISAHAYLMVEMTLSESTVLHCGSFGTCINKRAVLHFFKNSFVNVCTVYHKRKANYSSASKLICHF